MRGRNTNLNLSTLFLTMTLLGCLGADPASSQASEQREQEMTSRGQRDLVRAIRYGEWKKVCFKTPGAAIVCRTSISGTFPTGQLAVRADLVEREGESNARLQLFLPVGLYLQAGVKLTVDKGRSYDVPYVWCMTNTCIAGNRADPGLVLDMDQGQDLALEVIDSSVQSIVTQIPLSQFATVRKAAPAQTFQQEIDE